jgi:hypothetical protein
VHRQSTLVKCPCPYFNSCPASTLQPQTAHSSMEVSLPPNLLQPPW